MRKLIEEIATRLLDRVGTGWKSTLGIAAILVIKVLDQVDVISPELATDLYEWAVILFGVGVFHKAVRAKKSAEEATEESRRALNLAILHEELI